MELVTLLEGSAHVRRLMVDGRKVSWLTVVDLPMRIGSAVVRMGGIAGVGTDEAERMKGYSRYVLDDTVRYMGEQGFGISGLFGIRNFYPKFGYAVCLPSVTMKMAVRNAEAAKDRAAGYSVRTFTPADADDLLELYNNANALRTGTIVRTAEGFRELMKGTTWSRRAAVMVAEDASGRFAGYVGVDRAQEEVTVAEIEAADPGAYPALLYEIVKMAIDRRCSEITFHLPQGHPFAQFCCRYECTFTVHHQRCGGGMMRIINLETLFDKIRAELSRRLDSSRFRDCIGRVAISTDLGDMLLDLQRGEVALLPGETCEWRLELPQSKLMQLVVGYRSAADLLTDDDVTLHGDALPLLDTLFPKTEAYMWAADHF